MHKVLFRLIGVVLSLSLVMGSHFNADAAANIYYVSTTGNDANAGTFSAPFKTIQKCVNTANSGYSCVVAAGTYGEQVKIAKDGITLEANGKVITKQIYVPGSNNVVRGFAITDKTANNGIEVNGNFTLFENNEIYQTKQDGIWFFGHDNTFRGNYIHDILDSSIASQFPAYDEHADCFQTWDWSWDTYNVLFEGNICNHNRAEGSNQSVMLSGSRVHDVTFRNNRFIMSDAGYSPLALYGGSGFVIESNYFCNSTGKGTPAVYLEGAANVMLSNNTQAGYSSLVSGNGVLSQTGSLQVALPCQMNATTVIPTVTPTTAPFTATPTASPTPTVIASLVPASPTPTMAPATPIATLAPLLPTATETAPMPIAPTITPTSIPPTSAVAPTAMPISEIIYDNTDSAFVYSAGWKTVSKRQAYNGSYKLTTRNGSFVAFTFTGQSFSILYTGGSAFRKMVVYVDDMQVGVIDEKVSRLSFQQRWNYTGLLVPGTHTLKLVFSTTNSSNKTNGSIDAVIVR